MKRSLVGKGGEPRSSRCEDASASDALAWGISRGIVRAGTARERTGERSPHARRLRDSERVREASALAGWN